MLPDRGKSMKTTEENKAASYSKRVTFNCNSRESERDGFREVYRQPRGMSGSDLFRSDIKETRKSYSRKRGVYGKEKPGDKSKKDLEKEYRSDKEYGSQRYKNGSLRLNNSESKTTSNDRKLMKVERDGSRSHGMRNSGSMTADTMHVQGETTCFTFAVARHKAIINLMHNTCYIKVKVDE